MKRDSVQKFTVEPASIIDAEDYTLPGRSGRYVKLVKDLAGVYRDAEAYAAWQEAEGENETYRVDEFRPSGETGDLIYGLSVLHPGVVGREYVVTRGHLHARADRAETYQCLAGHGLMLMEDLAGETTVIELEPGQVAYVPPFHLHRSVNVGDEDFVTLFTYPADSGQDYEIISRAHGMRHIAVATEDGGWTLEENPDYVARH